MEAVFASREKFAANIHKLCQNEAACPANLTSFSSSVPKSGICGIFRFFIHRQSRNSKPDNKLEKTELFFQKPCQIQSKLLKNMDKSPNHSIHQA